MSEHGYESRRDHVSDENENGSGSGNDYLSSASDGGRPQGRHWVYETVLHENASAHPTKQGVSHNIDEFKD